MVRRLLALLLSVAPVAAQAAPRTLVASSTHFTIYADQDEASLRTFAESLESYDAVLRRLTGVQNSDDDVVPLTIFVREDQSDLDAGPNVLGYYRATAAGALAVVPQKVRGISVDSVPRIVLFHEYAHHFTLQNFPWLYSPWSVEGLAEFYSTIELGDGTATIGKPEPLRIRALKSRQLTALRYLLAPGERGLSSEQVSDLYASAWLLVHYLTLSKERGGQIDAYLRTRSSGANEEAAFQTALRASIPTIDRELRKYFSTGSLSYRVIERPPAVPVAIRPVTAGEAAAIDMIPRLRLVQVYASQATDKTTKVDRRWIANAADRLADKGRGLVRRFPDDPTVLEVAAESAALAGDWDDARAAATHLLELSPKSSRARLVLAQVAVGAAPAGDAAAAAAARKEILAANRARPNDPLPLIANFRSYADRGATIPQNAVDGLFRAYQLVPQDERVRLMLAREWINRKIYPQAAELLRPIAFDPHESPNQQEAKTLLAAIPPAAPATGPAAAPAPRTP